MRLAATTRRLQPGLVPGQPRQPGPQATSLPPAPQSAGTAAPAVHYRIERLVLDGVPLTARQQQELAASLQQELASLLQQAQASGEAGLPAASAALARLSGARVSYGQPCDARDLGQQIARTLHASILGEKLGESTADSLIRSTRP